MRKKYLITVLSLFSAFLLISGLVASADTELNQVVYVNGTAYLETTYDDGTTDLKEVVYVNGTSYVNITLKTGNNRLERLEKYVDSLGSYVEKRGASWSDDQKGLQKRSLARLLNDVVKYQRGKDVDLSKSEKAILNSIMELADRVAERKLRSNVYPALKKHQNKIQDNIYSIESLRGTLQITAPDKHCSSKIRVMHKYNLSSVECGRNSKICYNGEKNSLYGSGEDYCISLDDETSQTSSQSNISAESQEEEEEVTKTETNSSISPREVLTSSETEKNEKQGDKTEETRRCRISYSGSEKPRKETIKIVASVNSVEKEEEPEVKKLSSGLDVIVKQVSAFLGNL